ncbi:MAG TPA: FAD-dependent oxidoreductase, partial [Solirubrobacteraceae bacterium]|nr:FAD-dependent oxidoreductase [Solirubrobacteraceae bacterium]
MSEASDARRPVVAAGDVERWDAEVDVVVVGAGGSALTAAVMAAEAGASVLVLEKAAEIGGTTAKSGGGVWVPLNRHMKALGIPDSREGALRYMARTSRPALYSPGASHMGLPEWEYEGLCLFVDEGATAFASLEDIGALAMAPVPDFPNYYTAVPEDVHKRGRGMSPVDDDGVPADGTEMIRQLSEALFRRGGSIRVEHRAVGAVVDGDRVVGVVARTPAGAAAFHAARGVVFGSGGFTHDPELRRAYLQGPVFGGCAAITNEGDFVPIAQELGAEMRNMTEAWCVPVILERALARDPDLHGTFNIVGDSMLCVNRHGRRVMNEKLLYNETGGPMRAFDAAHSEYPNMLLFAIFDQACLERFRGSVFDGGLMPMPGDDDRHVLHADTLAGLGAAIDARLAEIEHE